MTDWTAHEARSVLRSIAASLRNEAENESEGEAGRRRRPTIGEHRDRLRKLRSRAEMIDRALDTLDATP